MKKLLSLALAVAMVLSMASVVFAKTEFVYAVDSLDNVGQRYKVQTKEVWLKADNSVSYGNTLYYLLMGYTYVKDGGTILSDPYEEGPVTKYDAVKGVKITQDWDLGGEWVSKVDLVKKKFGTAAELNKVNTTDAAIAMNKHIIDRNLAGKYYYFLAISLKSAPTKSEGSDVAGTVLMKKTSGDNKINRFGLLGTKEGESFKYDIDFEIKYTVRNSLVDIDDTSKTFDFEEIGEDEELELSFTKWEGASFIVNTYGQGKIVLKATTDYNADVGAMYPDANLDFFNGNGAVFNKTGEMFIPAEEGSYIYELKNGALVAIPSAEYDEYDEGFYFRTRTLGVYVVSDSQLDLTSAPSVSTPGDGGISVVEPGDAPSVTVPVNPGTGAAA